MTAAPNKKRKQMRKYISAFAALGAALSFATFVPIADARSGGSTGGGSNVSGGAGGHGGGGHASGGRSGGHVAGNFGGRSGYGGRGHGGHWRGGGIGYGAGVYLGDAYDDDYDSCYYRRGRRICRY
jgi:hypothetical protein